MIKASNLKEGDKFTSKETGCNFTVITNKVGDKLLLGDGYVSWYSGIRLFYRNETHKEFALNTFGIILE